MQTGLSLEDGHNIAKIPLVDFLVQGPSEQQNDGITEDLEV